MVFYRESSVYSHMVLDVAKERLKSIRRPWNIRMIDELEHIWQRMPDVEVSLADSIVCI